MRDGRAAIGELQRAGHIGIHLELLTMHSTSRAFVFAALAASTMTSFACSRAEAPGAPPPASGTAQPAAQPAATPTASTASTPGALPAPGVPLAQLPRIDPQRVLQHIKVMSSNKFEGRAPGTNGEELSVAYIETQFQDLKLKPGNPDGTFIQKVPLAGITATNTRPLTFVKGSQALGLKWKDDVVAWSKHVADSAAITKSDVIFAGYGVEAPEFKWNDFKDVDVKGKTIVVLVNDPPVPDPADSSKLDPKTFGGDAMTYYGRWTYKFEEGARKGAAAVLIVHEEKPAGYPFSVVQGNLNEKFDIVTPDKNMGRVNIEGWITSDAARKLFALGGQDYDALKKQAVSRDFKPVPLGVQASMAIGNKLRTIESRNVVAKLEGSDPALKDEYVVYSAHWDHLGVGAPVKGDAIYNGALDNASGVGTVLEIARAFTEAAPQPKRSILFLMVTAEEQGLLGSQVLLGDATLSAGEDRREHQHRRHQSVGQDEGRHRHRPRGVGSRRLPAPGGAGTKPHAYGGSRTRKGLLLPVRSLQLREAGRTRARSGFRRGLHRKAGGLGKEEARRVHRARLSRSVRRGEA